MDNVEKMDNADLELKFSNESVLDNLRGAVTDFLNCQKFADASAKAEVFLLTFSSMEQKI